MDHPRVVNSYDIIHPTWHMVHQTNLGMRLVLIAYGLQYLHRRVKVRSSKITVTIVTKILYYYMSWQSSHTGCTPLFDISLES